MGRLEIIMGSMFSGKSSELIRRVKRHLVINERVLVINSSKDTRSDKSVLRTHDDTLFECIKTNYLLSIDTTYYDVIAIDEAQFFNNLLEFVDREVLRKKCIIVAGLDGDFQQKPIGQILQLVPLSDDVTKLSALCMGCRDGTPGPFTQRTGQCLAQELVGANELYRAVCRSCLKNNQLYEGGTLEESENGEKVSCRVE